MPQTHTARAPRRHKRRSAIYAPVLFFVICAAVIFAMSVFFRVAEIDVTGNAMYTTDEIKEAAGIEPGDNLFFINRFTAVSRIYSRLPYIEEASITRQLPNKLHIEVSESKSIAYVTIESQNWAIDRNGKLLTKDEELSGLIRIIGLEPVDPAVGEQLNVAEGEEPKVAYLKEILHQIQERALEASVTQIDISTAANPSFDYIGRFTVRLGSKADTEYKFGQLLGAVAQLASGDTGVIDLSVDDKPHFYPQ